MKQILIPIILIFLNIVPLFPQNYENILLNDIINDAAKYKNKDITLKLRLKNIDRVFNKIIFYDRKNIDITFDISGIKKTRLFKSRILNLHEGMEYIVKFKATDIIKENGLISGELIDFQPELIFRLPEGQKNQKAE